MTLFSIFSTSIIRRGVQIYSVQWSWSPTFSCLPPKSRNFKSCIIIGNIIYHFFAVYRDWFHFACKYSTRVGVLCCLCSFYEWMHWGMQTIFPNTMKGFCQMIWRRLFILEKIGDMAKGKLPWEWIRNPCIYGVLDHASTKRKVPWKVYFVDYV